MRYGEVREREKSECVHVFPIVCSGILYPNVVQFFHVFFLKHQCAGFDMNVLQLERLERVQPTKDTRPCSNRETDTPG